MVGLVKEGRKVSTKLTQAFEAKHQRSESQERCKVGEIWYFSLRDIIVL